MPTSGKSKPRTRKEPPASSVEETFRLNLPDARRERGFTSQAQLAKRLNELGYPMHATAVARIESGARKVTLAEALAITAALGCQFAHLVTPAAEKAKVRLAPRMAVEASRARDWLRGVGPLYLDDARFYFTGKLVPDSELEEFFARRPSWGSYGVDRPAEGE